MITLNTLFDIFEHNIFDIMKLVRLICCNILNTVTKEQPRDGFSLSRVVARLFCFFPYVLESREFVSRNDQCYRHTRSPETGK